MSGTRRIVTGIFSTWASFLLSAVTSLLMAPFLVTRLGNEGYGLWSLYMAITGYFTLLDFGITPAVVRYTSKYQALGETGAEKRVLWTALAVFLATASLVGGLTALGTVFYDVIFPVPQVSLSVARLTFLFVGLDFAITLPFAVLQGLLLGHQRYLLYNGLNMGLRLTRVGLVLGLVGPGAEELVTVAAIWLFTGLARDVFLLFSTRQSLGGLPQVSDFRREVLRDIVGYSLPAFVISLALRVMAYTDSLVIGYTLGVASVTYFALAASLVDYVQELGWGLAGVLVPVVSGHEARGELREIQEKFLQFTRYCVWLMVPILIISYLLAVSFFTAWVGPAYTLSATLLYILMAAMAVYVIQLPGQAVLKGMSLHAWLARLMAAEAVLNLCLSLALARPLGVVGVALGTLIPRLLITGLIQPAYTLRRLQVPLGRYLLEGFLPVWPGAVCGLGMALGLSTLWPGPHGWAAMVGIGGLVGTVCGAATYRWGANPGERAWVRSRLAAVQARLLPS